LERIYSTWARLSHAFLLDLLRYCSTSSGLTRSARAVNLLKTQGYSKVKNVAGGINAWAERIDPNVP
jgi:predicted sulfurtransferase